jgi:energy-coupling factor transporter transmembrane protein EcfT
MKNQGYKLGTFQQLWYFPFLVVLVYYEQIPWIVILLMPQTITILLMAFLYFCRRSVILSPSQEMKLVDISASFASALLASLALA